MRDDLKQPTILYDLGQPLIRLSHSLNRGFMPTKEVSVEEILPVDLFYQRSIPEMLLDLTEELVTRLQEDYDRQYKNSSQPCKFSITTGRKYHKILDRKGSVHAFVNKQTGEVFKPASWNAPAQHVRYDLRVINDRNRCFENADWAGSYLYLRG